MKIEIEARLLDINEKQFIEKLKIAGAYFVGDWLMKRNVYDFNPIDDGKWIRLRTNGEKTTIAIKEVVNNSIDGTKEIEMEVESFDTANEILNKLGYHARGSQINRRIRFLLDEVEFDIDFWPMIPTYVELESNSIDKIKRVCKKLDINFDDLTTKSVPEVYLHYGIDIRVDCPKHNELEKERVEMKFDLE
jgi:adenylate cyclase class 2